MLCAVGFRSGEVRIYKVANWELINTISDSKEWIEDLKFSPDSEYLAVGSHDNNVYIYDTTKFKHFNKCVDSSSFISHLDWSKDS